MSSSIEASKDTSVGSTLSNRASVVIEAKSGWQPINFTELFEFRDLFGLLIYRAIRSRYAQSVLGLAWAIIQPVATMLVFTVIFGKMVGVESEGAPYALFSFVALVPWTFFQNALSSATDSLINEKNMISKIYFPRLVLPLSGVLARMIDFGIAILLLFVMLLWYDQVPNLGALMIPFLVILMLFSSAGIGMWLSAMAVQYRDISYAMNFVVRLLMYASPVVYPTSLVPEQYQLLYNLNPMVGVIEGFRAGLLGSPMPWEAIAISTVVSTLLLIFGAYYFRKNERIFADVA